MVRYEITIVIHPDDGEKAFRLLDEVSMLAEGLVRGRATLRVWDDHDDETLKN